MSAAAWFLICWLLALALSSGIMIRGALRRWERERREREALLDEAEAWLRESEARWRRRREALERLSGSKP